MSAVAETAPPNLMKDNRGAVMLTGLFMSCFLIGSLWFIIGIGDTIVFRNKMQEATDSGAFASAALHAKGMNFISLCNLLILAAVTIHIIMGLISDILLAIAIVACLTVVGCAPAVERWLSWEQKWISYFNKMKKGAKAVHKAQVVASYAYPAMGLVEAGQQGRKYTSRGSSPPTVIALSSSLLPGSGPIMKMLGQLPQSGQQRTNGQAIGASITKFGLPVEAKPFSHHCQKIVKVGFNALVGLTGMAPTGRVMDVFKSLIGGALEFRYCNKISGIDPGWDSFWGEDGAMVAWAPNGSPFYQTWALNVNPTLYDDSQSKVGLAAKQYAKYTKNESPGMYMTQSEFYFDCDEGWRGTNCNYEDNATYQIKWRARLRRLQAPAIASGLFTLGFSMLQNLPAYKDFKDRIGALGGQGTLTESQIKAIISRIEAELVKAIAGGGGGLAGKLDPKVGGIYH